MPSLNDIEFDHVFRVLDDGVVVDGPSTIWAPDFRNDELSGYYRNGVADRWEQFSAGYTGQYGTATPMHNSEFIGGRLEKDILATPGIYAVVVCYWDCENDECDGGSCEECSGEGPEPEGWCVARLVSDE